MELSKVQIFLLYNAPLFILFVVWLFFRTREYRGLQIVRLLVDIAVISIAAARFYGLPIPASGHAIFLTHSIISLRNRYYRLAALAMLIVTVCLKISWNDYTSWSYGIVLGVISGMSWVWAGRNSDHVRCRI